MMADAAARVGGPNLGRDPSCVVPAVKGHSMSTITLSKAKELVGDRSCQIGDFLYMNPVAVQSSLGNSIGIGATVESAKLDAETEADRTKVPLDHHQLFRIVPG